MKSHGDMDVVYFSNEFPTGDLQAIFRQLYNNSQDSSHNVLAQLISRATAAVKNEIQSLPTGLLQLFSSFESLFEWADDSNLRTGPLCGAVDGVLLVLVQLALYINHVGDDFARHRNMKQAHLAALGVGLLSGAAVSMAPVVADIPLHGADAIVLAFRMGIHVQSISSQLETHDASERPETWAYVVHNIDAGTVQAELDALHGSTPGPNTNKIFISAISETSVTISGPPSRLKSLFQRSKLFRDATSIALPVYGGLCHAPHVYGSHDIQVIVHKGVKELHAKLEQSSEPMNMLHSTSSGDPYHAANGVELFELVVAELLTKAIEWNKVIASLVSCVKISSLASITLNCFGNSIPLHDLEETLKESFRDTKISVISLLSSLQDPTWRKPTSRGFKQTKLAIVGMSCRLPGGATDTEKFWEVLENGLDVSREIPPDRFDIDTHFDAEGKDMNKTMTRYGCFIDDPASFDAAFFNMSPREALAVDPQMRLMLVTAYEALERAGFVGNRTLSTRLDRIGTYFGQAADDYREVNQGQEVGTYYIPGGCRAFGPGRVNYFFKFSGPSYSVDTACSSGLAAIELACQALWNGNVDMVVTGGVNILTNPDGFTGLGKGHFLTKGHNACKTWDATADGYCRADGIGSLVIKRLEDAQADNDNILGLILATGTNHSAEAVSITHPHAGHQAYLSKQVVRQAGINPLDVSYIELHGTGTQAGDYEEMKGVLDVYAPASAPRRRSDQPLHIGTVKSNLGHGESVAGTTALVKVLLMLQKNAIPRHIGIKTEINPRFPKDFDKRNVHIPFSHTPWVQQTRKRIAAVNNFGAAGGNTMMIVEEAPTRTAPQTGDTRGTHAVVVSAKTKTSLTANIQNLVDHLRNSRETVSLPDLGYTTTARRYQHSYRAAVTASSIDQIIAKLLAQSEKVNAAKPVGKTGTTAPSVAFAFTGQGASYSSMALELYHDAPTFRDHIQHLDALVQGQGFPSFISAIDGTHPRDYVHSAIVTQLALVCIEMALAHYWQSLGVTPDVVIGHSLGEYAAMQVAGVISASDAIFMVGKRAEMLQNACEPNTYCMLAVRAPLQNIVETARGKPYTVACINSPTDTVLSGTVSDMGNISHTLEAAGFRCIKLKVPYAFHSEQTDPILDEFEATCRSGVVFHEPKLPIISPLLCKVVFDDRTFNAEYVRRATREAVDFVSALENAEGVSIDSDTIWIEIGPHPVCTGFVHSTLSSQMLALPSVRRDENNWKTLAETMSKLYLAGVGLNWNEFHRPFENQVRLLDLPTYAWDEKEYWMQYNGDWCLTKGNTYYDKSLNTLGSNSTHEQVSENVTSLVHKIVEKHIDGVGGSIVMRSDLMQKDFLAAANGHRMNDSGVVTSSIHADIAYTLGELLYKEFYPDAPSPDMEITNLVVEQALIAQKGSTSTPQMIQVTARTADIHLRVVNLTWQNVNRDMTISEPFVNASIVCGKAVDWLSSWAPIAHLVQHRIEMLDSLAARGEASRLTRSMAYTLFAKNLVDYTDKYRGMQSVVMRGLEGFADVELSTKEDSATWTVPPYFIDSVAHLAGFIMNCSDAIDTQANYCVTSGWSSMRFATPLVAGGQYRSYVRMVPTKEDPSAFLGDVIILRAEDNAIVGMVQGMRFRRFPRILLDRFFTAPVAGTDSHSTAQQRSAASNRPSTARTMPRAVEAHSSHVKLDNYDSRNEIPKQLCTDSQMYTEALGHKSKFQSPPSPKSGSSGDEIPTPPSKVGGIADQALALIARETALDITALVDDADFAGLGIDSLMSLVLAEKFRIELDVRVNGSLFLDYPTIGDLRSWLIDYHG